MALSNFELQRGDSQAGSLRLECEEQLEPSRTMDKVEKKQGHLCREAASIQGMGVRGWEG